MPSRTFSVVVPDELLATIDAAAKKAGKSRNRFVRTALEVALVQGGSTLDPPVPSKEEVSRERPSANFGSHERYGPRKPRGKPFQKS